MPSKERSYVSEVRQAGAEETRRRVLAAARELFSTRGFDKTTIAHVAEKAGVSAPSVYVIYKSKEGIVRELIRTRAFGPKYQALVEEVITSSEPTTWLRTAAAITRTVCEAERAELGLLRGAGLLSPELAEIEAEGERIRYDRQIVVAERLVSANAVRPGLDLHQVRDILWALTSRDLFRLMVVERGWTSDSFESWLTATLIDALMGKPEQP